VGETEEIRTSHLPSTSQKSSHIQYVLSRDIKILETAGLTANSVQSWVSRYISEVLRRTYKPGLSELPAY